jgi:hypothetical protein
MGARKSPGMASIANCPRPVFVKPTNLLAEKCTHLASARWLLAPRKFLSRPAMSPAEGSERSTLVRDRCCRKLAFPVNDPAFCQIIRREFDADAIARHNTDKMLPHPTGDVGHNDVSTFDLNAKTSIGQGLRDRAFDLECFFLLLCHTRLCPVNKMRQPVISKHEPVLSPLRLAESYNPSIVWAGRSSRLYIAG